MTTVKQKPGSTRPKPAAVRPAAAPTLLRLSPRERNKLDKRERIREAAYSLFRELGFDETSMAAVAERAAVAKGTLFLYCSDKDDLLCLVMHERLREAVDRLLTTLPRRADLLGQLMHLFGGLFDMYAEHPKLALSFIRIFPTALGPNGQLLRALTLGFLHQLSELVRAAVERSEVARDIAPMQAAHNLFALYFAALLAGVSGSVPSLDVARDLVLKGALELQIKGLAPR